MSTPQRLPTRQVAGSVNRSDHPTIQTRLAGLAVTHRPHSSPSLIALSRLTARVVATFSATFNVILIAIFILIAITKRARDFENDRSAKTRSAIVNVECGAKFSDFHAAHAL